MDEIDMRVLRGLDAKYERGEEPSLAERAQILKALNIPQPSERYARAVEEKLGAILVELSVHEYSRSLEIVAYDLLYCLCPFLDISKDKLERFDSWYKKIIKRHEKLLSFRKNSETARIEQIEQNK